MIHQPDHVGLGWDVAGTVVATGPGVDLRVGTRVAGVAVGPDRALGDVRRAGRAARRPVAVVPDELDLVDAATVPVNGLAAVQALDLLGPADGRTLLVTGAAGAVGGYALRLATEAGWSVTGLARSEDEEFVRAAGADFTTTPTGGFDAVLDAAILAADAIALVRDGGAYVGVDPGRRSGGRARHLHRVRLHGPGQRRAHRPCSRGRHPVSCRSACTPCCRSTTQPPPTALWRPAACAGATCCAPERRTSARELVQVDDVVVGGRLGVELLVELRERHAAGVVALRLLDLDEVVRVVDEDVADRRAVVVGVLDRDGVVAVDLRGLALRVLRVVVSPSVSRLVEEVVDVAELVEAAAVLRYDDPLVADERDDLVGRVAGARLPERRVGLESDLALDPDELGLAATDLDLAGAVAVVVGLDVDRDLLAAGLDRAVDLDRLPASPSRPSTGPRS